MKCRHTVTDIAGQGCMFLSKMSIGKSGEMIARILCNQLVRLIRPQSSPRESTSLGCSSLEWPTQDRVQETLASSPAPATPSTVHYMHLCMGIATNKLATVVTAYAFMIVMQSIPGRLASFADECMVAFAVIHNS